MEEPPDPGGTTPISPVPVAGCFVTIENDSVLEQVIMDIDDSLTGHNIENQSALNNPLPSTSGNKRRKKSHTTSNNDLTNEPVSVISPTPQSQQQQQINNETEKVNSKERLTNFIPVGRSHYDVTDSAPYIVHVQREQSSPNDGSTLHPITFGRFLQKHYIKNIVNGSVKRIGRNKITFSFNNSTDANAFINNNSLSNDKLKAFIPTYSITRMGLVRGVPTEWTDAEIIENTTVPTGCGKILKIRRLNYKVTIDGSPVWKPSQTVVVTFDGKILPKHIFICYNALAVELYTYPTIQCFKCCRFGHTKTQCRSKPRCFKCGNEHPGDSCEREEDSAVCCLCSGFHYATSKCCPEFSRQKKIKLSMAESSISYVEALKLHPPVGRSYADVLSTVKPTTVDSLPLPNHPLTPTRTSYKKTVQLKPRTPYNTPRGYDRVAHHELIKDYNMPTSRNGCGYARPSMNQDQTSQQTLTDIITLLIDTLTKNNILLPSNVAPLIEALNNQSIQPLAYHSEMNTFRNDTGQFCKNCPVELPQRS